jgi:hypothetical protein
LIFGAGQYPTTSADSLVFGAIHFNLKFGTYNKDTHRPGFLGNRVVEFIPVKHLKTKSLGSLVGWLVGMYIHCPTFVYTYIVHITKHVYLYSCILILFDSSAHIYLYIHKSLYESLYVSHTLLSYRRGVGVNIAGSSKGERH